MMRELICAVALTWATSVLAADTGAQTTQPEEKPTKTATTKSKQAKKAKADSKPGGSAESPADRTARLKRECRGAVNAGACTGYTQ
jgi:hypothetical protein